MEKMEYASLENIPGPSNYSVVAPFAADITTSSTGYVRYKSFTNSQLTVVSEHIRSETETSFYGIWMLVAEWNGVPLLSQSTVRTMSCTIGCFGYVKIIILK